jgi:hypothetical protein
MQWYRRLPYLKIATRPERKSGQGCARTSNYQFRTMHMIATRIAPKQRCDFQSEVRTSLTSGACHVPSPTSRRTDRKVKLQEPKELVATPNIRSYTHTAPSRQIRRHSKTASTRPNQLILRTYSKPPQPHSTRTSQSDNNKRAQATLRHDSSRLHSSLRLPRHPSLRRHSAPSTLQRHSTLRAAIRVIAHPRTTLSNPLIMASSTSDNVPTHTPAPVPMLPR